MTNSVAIFIAGFALAGIIFILLFSVDVILGENSFGLIEDCQKSLPRDQSCHLIAVPDKEN